MISDSAADKRADDSYLFDLDNRVRNIFKMGWVTYNFNYCSKLSLGMI